MQRHPKPRVIAKSVSNHRQWMLTVTLLLLLIVSLISLHGHAGVALASRNASTDINMSAGYQDQSNTSLLMQANAAYEQGEVYLAYRLWSALAEQGHAESAFRVGMLYDRGEGLDHDASRAAYWYIQAAMKGHAYAQHNLGVAYANGDGVEANISAALDWWTRAAEQGNTDSQYNLGIVYAMGSHGITRDAHMAAQWWRRAALQGDPMAQYNLGAMFANGERDVTTVCEAVHWLKQSAANGIVQATLVIESLKSRKDYRSCH